MAYQLLELVDGELTVCFEYGCHETLNTGASSWLTIYKRDASVCLSLTRLRAIVDEEYDATVQKDTTLDMSYENGELRIANSKATFKTPQAEPARHAVLLTPPEQRSLASMEPPLRAFAKVFSLGGVRVGWPDGSFQRKHTLEPRQVFRLVGTLHACEFMAAGALVLDPYKSIHVVCDCGAHTASAKAWAERAALRLTRVDADRLLEFNEAELAVDGGAVPRAGRVFRLNDERAVGVWPTQAYFPGADVEGGDKAEQAKAKKENAACALVPFTPAEWRWFCACLGLYLAAGDYLLRRERLEADRQLAKNLALFSPGRERQTNLPTLAPRTAGNESGREGLRRVAAKHRAAAKAAQVVTDGETTETE